MVIGPRRSITGNIECQFYRKAAVCATAGQTLPLPAFMDDYRTLKCVQLFKRVLRAEVRPATDRWVNRSRLRCFARCWPRRLEADADYILDRVIGLRVFADASGKMNLALSAVGGLSW